MLAASWVIVDMATLQAAAACWERACRWLSFAVFVSRFRQASIFTLWARAIWIFAVPAENHIWRKSRAYWVHLINLQRNVFGEYYHLESDLAHRFRSYFSMLPSTFSALLDLVRCKLTKQETAFQRPVTAEEEEKEEEISSTIITMVIFYSHFLNYHHDYD